MKRWSVSVRSGAVCADFARRRKPPVLGSLVKGQAKRDAVGQPLTKGHRGLALPAEAGHRRSVV